MQNANEVKTTNDALITRFNEIDRKYQEEKASLILNIARSIAPQNTESRDFHCLIRNKTSITHNDLIHGISASKIKNIDKYLHLGWDIINLIIIENKKNYDRLDFDEIEKEFGDLSIHDNLESYLIHTRLVSYGIKSIDKKFVQAEVKKYLKLRHITPTVLSDIAKSNNQTMTFKWIKYRAYKKEARTVLRNNGSHDNQKLCEYLLFFNDLARDEDRIKMLDRALLYDLCWCAREIHNSNVDLTNDSYEYSVFTEEDRKGIDDFINLILNRHGK